jgi:hypothetical protein
VLQLESKLFVFQTNVFELIIKIESYFPMKFRMGQTDCHVHGIFSLAACGLLNTVSQTPFQVIAGLNYINWQVAATSADPVQVQFS